MRGGLLIKPVEKGTALGIRETFFRRSNLLLIAYAVCLAFFVCVLYDAQIVHGADYLSESATQVTTTQKVKTFRGSITDRNGKVLVSNRQVYTVSFDPDLVADEADLIPAEGNTVHSESVARAMLRLLQLLREQGIVWEDGYQDMLREVKPFLNGMKESGAFAREQMGVRVLLSERSSYTLHTRWGEGMEELYPQEAFFAGYLSACGVPFRFQTDIPAGETAAVSGQFLRNLAEEDVRRLFRDNFVLLTGGRAGDAGG